MSMEAWSRRTFSMNSLRRRHPATLAAAAQLSRESCLHARWLREGQDRSDSYLAVPEWVMFSHPRFSSVLRSIPAASVLEAARRMEERGYQGALKRATRWLALREARRARREQAQGDQAHGQFGPVRCLYPLMRARELQQKGDVAASTESPCKETPPARQLVASTHAPSNPLARASDAFLDQLRASGYTVGETGPSDTTQYQARVVPAPSRPEQTDPIGKRLDEAILNRLDEEMRKKHPTKPH